MNTADAKTRKTGHQPLLEKSNAVIDLSFWFLGQVPQAAQLSRFLEQISFRNTLASRSMSTFNKNWLKGLGRSKEMQEYSSAPKQR
jgi:hypothetical protein